MSVSSILLLSNPFVFFFPNVARSDIIKWTLSSRTPQYPLGIAWMAFDFTRGKMEFLVPSPPIPRWYLDRNYLWIDCAWSAQRKISLKGHSWSLMNVLPFCIFIWQSVFQPIRLFWETTVQGFSILLKGLPSCGEILNPMGVLWMPPPTSLSIFFFNMLLVETSTDNNMYSGRSLHKVCAFFGPSVCHGHLIDHCRISWFDASFPNSILVECGKLANCVLL